MKDPRSLARRRERLFTQAGARPGGHARPLAMRATVAAGLLMCAGGAVAAAPKAVPAAKAPAIERLTCRTGPNDEQARLIAQMVRGRPMEFAYYSRLGTAVCSIHARRGDAYTKWQDGSGSSTVKLIEGRASLEYKPGYLKIKFDEVDRMTYCGTEGELNGVIEVWLRKSECDIHRVFD